MEFQEFLRGGDVWAVDLHLTVEAIAEDEVMGKLEAVGLFGRIKRIGERRAVWGQRNTIAWRAEAGRCNK